MRRFAILAFVLGLGGALLWHFEAERRQENKRGPGVRVVDRGSDRLKPPPVGPDDVGAGAAGSGAGAPGPGETEPGGAQTGDGADDNGPRLLEGERFVTGGAQKHNLPPRRAGEPRVLLVAKDTRLLDRIGTKYKFIDVDVDSYVVDGSPRASEPLSSSIHAATARVELLSDDLGFEFDDDLSALLQDVVVEQFLGSPLAPLTLEAPRLDAKLALEELRSIDDDLVTFRSRDVRGSGRGMVALGSAESFVFERGADVSIELGDGRQARITTTEGGALSIVEETPPENRDGGGPRLVRVRAQDGVQVLFQSTGTSDDPEGRRTPMTIDAASVDVLLAIVEGAARPLVQAARADGAVAIRQGRDTYTGDTARIVFDGPSPVRVVLEETPKLSYIVSQPDGTELKLEVTGAGPVTGYLVGDAPPPSEDPVDPSRLRFVFVGPGRIEAVDRGGVVTFENEARGQGLEDRTEATVLVSGDVHVTTVEGMLDSESLLVTYRAEEELRVASEGPTRIVARAVDTIDEYRARAGGGLTAHLVGESWFVDRAEDFHAETLGEDPHRIDAVTVSNVDLAARTLSARGDIRYQSLWGEVRAADALVRGESSIVLTGTEEVPVVLDLVPEGATLMAEAEEIAGIRTGSVRAVTLTLQEDAFRAEGRVDAQFETLEGVWGFDSDTLRVQRTILPAGIGEGAAVDAGSKRPRSSDEIRIEADFVREARYDATDGRTTFAARRVVLDGVILGAVAEEQRASELDPDREVTVRALGEVTAVMESLGPAPATVLARWSLKGNSALMTRGARDPERDGRAPFNLIADQVDLCRYEGGGRIAELSAASVEIDATLGAEGVPRIASGSGAEGSKSGTVDLTGSSLVAKGDANSDVDLTYRAAPGEPSLRGKGDLFTLVDGERGRLAADRGQRVRATGILPGEAQPYTMTAKEITFTRSDLQADTPVIEFAQATPIEQFGNVSITRLSADRLVADRRWMTLTGDEGDVVGTGLNPAGGPITVRTKYIRLDLDDLRAPQRTLGPFAPVPPQEEDDDQDGTRLGRGEGFEVDFGNGIVVRGDDGGFTGDVLRIEGRPAHVEANETSLDAEYIEIDLADYLINAGRGAIRGPGARAGEFFTLEFAQIESRVLEKEILITIAAPRVDAGENSARADYIAFFIDRERWKAKGDSVYRGVPMPEFFTSDDEVAAARDQPNFLAELLFDLQSEDYGGYLRSVYIEGGFEITRADRRGATGSKLYIDLPRAIAWMQDVELVYPLMTRGKEVPLRVRTDRLATDEEGRLVALGATLTTCNHDDPHFVVRTREFALAPRGDGRWRFGAKGNRIKFQGGLAMPLPSIGNVVLDEDFGVEGFENEAGEVTPLSDIGIAQTARFGAVVGAAFRFDVGSFGSWIAERIGMDTSNVRGKWDTEAQYLWDRGPLVGLGLQLRERKPGDNPDEDFRLDSFIGGIPDDGEDRGTVRVDEADRDSLRVWGYARSRYPIVRGEWLDVAVASQTDAGIQPEFYEGEYQRFEQRDTFVRWRKSLGADYLTGGVQKRIDDFRSQKEELPSFLAYRGERSVGRFTGIPVLYGGNLEVGYFKRTEGEEGKDLFSDLPGGAQLGIGNGEAARADLTQRVSFPISTDLAGIRATPFAELRGTAWTDSLDGSENPARGAAITGMELSTTLHKVTDNGYLHALAPRISVATDVWYDEDGGPLIPFDRTEAPIDGTTYEAGLRALWQRPATFEALDVDLRTILREDRENDLADSSELGALARYVTRYGSGRGQVGLLHDARYDLEQSETTYTRSTLAVRPNDVFLVGLSYSQARAIDRTELYETAGIRGRWKVDPKWEIEAGYVQDLRGDQQLLTEFVLRRFSHDFVLDISFQDRAGEGGTSISFSLAPLLGWSRDRMGMLDR